MKNFRMLFFGLAIVALSSLFIIACQKKDVAPEEVSSSEVLPELGDKALAKKTPKDLGLQYIAMTDESWDIYKSGGLNELLAFLGIKPGEEVPNEEVPPYNEGEEEKQKYCNYKLIEVLEPSFPITPYPGPGWRFCVVCPPLCGPFGLLYSVEPVTDDGTHYVAYVKLNQAGPGCEDCLNQNPGAVVPRAN